MGFGGLTVSLAKEFPNEVILGIEIRAKVKSKYFYEFLEESAI